MTTATKKKKLAALEAQEEELKQTLERLRRDRSKQQAKLTKLEESQGPVIVAPKYTTMDIFNASNSILDTFSRAENFFPTESVDDAITVWNFLNTFNKQLMLNPVSWDDFAALVNYTAKASTALTDIFCAPLKLILSDSTSLNHLNASLPKRVHFYSEEKNAGVDVEGMVAEQLSQTFANAEIFDNEYNGFKFFAHRLTPEAVDHIRWQCVLRAVLLRLEPVKQLRRAVLEVAVAYDLVTKQQLRQQQLSAASEQLQSTSKMAKLLAVGTTPRKKAKFDASAEPAPSVSATPGVLPITDEVMERINTPRNKAKRKGLMQGLNKDAIFGMTANYTAALDRISSAAVALETQEVHSLSVVNKLIILRTLCEACYDTTRITELLERNADERANQITAMNKKLKEQKAKMKEVTTAKKDLATDICRNLMMKMGPANAGAAGGENKKKSSASKKKNTGTASDKAVSQPSTEMVNAMIDDLVMLEEYGITYVVPDLQLEEVSDDEADEAMEDSYEEEDVYVGGRRRQASAASRVKAKESQRIRDEKRYRNQVIEQAQLRLLDAIESREEKALRSAIRNAERAKFRAKDERGRVTVTVSLKNAYRALYEFESRAKDERELFKHEKLLEEFFVRTQPVGVDRFGNHFWRFNVDDHRVFVQLKSRGLPGSTINEKTNVLLSAAPPSEGSQAEIVLNKLFVSRPGDLHYQWRIYSSHTELWRIVSALHEGIDTEKELKRKLIAAYDLSEPAVEYVSEGHEWIGRKVARTFGRKKVIGTVVGWAPPTNEDAALWRVMHTDGDEEDLEEHEVLESLVEDEEEDEEEEEEAEGEENEEAEDGDENSDEEGSSSSGEEVETEDAKDESATSEVASAAATRASDHDGDVEADFPSSNNIPTTTTTTNNNNNNKGRLSASTSASNLKDKDEAAPQLKEQEEPRLVKNQNGLSRTNVSGRALLFPPGITGLRLEISRLLSATYDLLKKRGAAVDREAKRSLESSLRACETLAEVKPLLLGLEELMRSVQQAEDRHDADELARQRAAQRVAMEAEGWLFAGQTDHPGVGRSARRFFRRFGKSDGEILAILPADKNDGTALFRMVHSDGDEEDIDETDMQRALRAFDSNWTERDARRALAKERKVAERKETRRLQRMDVDEEDEDEEDEEEEEAEGANEGEMAVDSEDEDDSEESEESEEEDMNKAGEDDGDDDEEEEDRNGFPSLRRRLSCETSLPEDARRLWPTSEVRRRWCDAIQAAHTVGEVAMGTALLEEVAYSFGVLAETDASTPLLFRPPTTATTTTTTGSHRGGNNNSNSNKGSISNRGGAEQRQHQLWQQQYGTATGHHMLSPRKAKKHALGEIARQSREQNSLSFDNSDSDSDQHVRGGNNQQHHQQQQQRGGGGGSRRSARSQTSQEDASLYNSGRPSRSASQRVVSYAE
jgi:hypothetical protein